MHNQRQKYSFTMQRKTQLLIISIFAGSMIGSFIATVSFITNDYSTYLHSSFDNSLQLEDCNDNDNFQENKPLLSHLSLNEEHLKEQYSQSIVIEQEALELQQQEEEVVKDLIPQQLLSEEKEEERIYPESHACSIFKQGTGHEGREIPSAIQIWKQYLSKVVNATRHEKDNIKEFLWHDFTVELLNVMNSQRLQQSVKTLPIHYWDRVGDILDLVHQRWIWLDKNKDSSKTEANSKSEPRKVNILILGGSVTLGVQCHENPVMKALRFGRKPCSWTSRLQQFIKAMTNQRDLVNFNQITLGGTNTASATTFWNYSLFPNDVPYPDIIINSFSTNDVHVQSIAEAKESNVTLEEYIFDMNEEFVRSVLSNNPPPPFTVENNNGIKERCEGKVPLLLYYDDYLGNEQREIRQTLSFNRAINTLSVYYGFGFISYADAVRDLVYAKTSEGWFSPHGWPDRQIHPGMGMHITSAWVFAFNFLNLATTYCDAMSRKNSDILTLLRDKTKRVQNGPLEHRPLALPPKLDQNLTLDNISKLWQNAAESDEVSKKVENRLLPQCDTITNKSLPMTNKCFFSWIGDMIDKKKIEEFKEEMDPFLWKKEEDNDDDFNWEFSHDNGKTGYIATKTNAKFTLRFTDIHHTVSTLNFMVMTSYGSKWEGSMVHIDALVMTNSTDLNSILSKNSMEIVGYHDKETSESVIHKLVLDKKAEFGNTLVIDVQLKGGSAFKMTGMAFC